DGEVEVRRHLQENFELMNRWFVFGRGDVELDETGDRLFARLLADAQVGRLPAERANTTCLDPQFVKSAVFQTRWSKPIGRKRRFHPAWKKKVAERSLDAESIQRFLLALPAVVSQVDSGLANLPHLAG